MTAQSVILPLPSDHARFLVLRLKYLSIAELKEKLADLFSTRDRLITQHPHAQIKTASGRDYDRATCYGRSGLVVLPSRAKYTAIAAAAAG